MIACRGGPMDNYYVSSNLFHDGQALIVVSMLTRPGSHTTREAVYRIVNDENGFAEFIGWQDELLKRPNPLAEAMANATDDEILQLLDDVERLRRLRKGNP